MPSAIAECVKLFGIAKIEPGLLAHPFAQTLLQSALRFGIKRSERQRIFAVLLRHNQGAGILFFDRNNRRRKADAYGGLAHKPARGKAVAVPSNFNTGGPIACSAAI